jgi:hypothetical protein
MKLFFALFLTCISALSQPLALNPANPHYFILEGKPLIIITSGEHYGAVLNLDFNYERYLDTLAGSRLNGTRTFSGAYVEPYGSFNIVSNTLAPAPGRFICPWARSSVTGYANGGNKFDLERWDDAYFKRLRDFVGQAEKRGIIVEMNLFCPFYDESQWKISPQNAGNNVNHVGAIPRNNAYTLDKNGGLLKVQEAMTRKIVTELNGFDNVYYEICNEPYFGGVTLDWQHHIAGIIEATEKALPKKHLISRNVQNGSAKVDHPLPAISIFNFHYASPPVTVAMNYALNKVIGDNETGFRGTNNLPYRVEAWSFILAGGGLFNNLDYSFIAGRENGTFVYPASQPGGGNPVYRQELKILHDFIYGFDFTHLKPISGFVKAGLPPGFASYALGTAGQAYALYIGHLPEKNAKPASTPRTVQIQLSLPSGNYVAQWIDVLTGKVLAGGPVAAKLDLATLSSPGFLDDIALDLRKAK